MDGPSPAERNAMALRLISRKKLQEALDLLNETIRQDSRFAASFENRAAVFAALGLHPQAAADRRKAAALRAARPASRPATDAAPPHSEPAEEAPHAVAAPGDETPEAGEAAPPGPAAETDDAGGPDVDAALPEASGVPPDEPPLVMPSYQPRPQGSIGSAMLRAAGVILFALGVFVLVGAGIYFALDSIGGSESASPTPTLSASPAPGASDALGGGSDTDPAGTAGVPPTVEEALAGSPYAFAQLEDAWHARALAVTVGEISELVTGFGAPAVDVTLTGNGATMELSVLIYASAEAKNAEWTIGADPQPTGDGDLPAGASVWYNANAIIIVRSTDPVLRQDALDGVLALGQGGEETPDGDSGPAPASRLTTRPHAGG